MEPRPSSTSPDISRHFGAVFVISKKGDHPRKRTIEKALSQCGITHEFLDATMGNELRAEEIAAVYDEQAALHHKTISRKLHVSNIGCCLSHRRAYAEVQRRGLPSALILEDDAEPIPEQLVHLEQCISELPADWDLLYLGIRGHRRAPFTFWLKLYLLLPLARLLLPSKYRLSHAETSRLYLRPYSNWLDRAGYHQGTHAYAVSRKGADILYAHGERISAPADATIGTLIIEGKLNAFAVRENMFTTTGMDSQIVHGKKGGELA